MLVGLAPYRALRSECMHGASPQMLDALGCADSVVDVDASEHLTNLGLNLASSDDGTVTGGVAAAAADTEAVAVAAEAAAASRETDAAAFSAASGVRTLRISDARFEGRTLDRRLVETLCAAECR